MFNSGYLNESYITTWHKRTWIQPGLCDPLKADSLCASLAHETKSQTRLAAVDALFAAV